MIINIPEIHSESRGLFYIIIWSSLSGFIYHGDPFIHEVARAYSRVAFRYSGQNFFLADENKISADGIFVSPDVIAIISPSRRTASPLVTDWESEGVGLKA